MGRSKGAGRRPSKRRSRRRVWGAMAILAAAVAAGIAVGAWFVRPAGNDEALLRAAIVDQLSLTAPNPSFAASAAKLLRDAGYSVDYYPGEATDVAFYRQLPTKGYDIVLLRNHAARRPDVLAARLPDEAALFTSELYDRNRYVDDQEALRLVKVSYPGADEVYFGVRSDFIAGRMQGDFAGAVIILMGCDGLATERVAAAFVARGAGAVVGWSGAVTPTHTDDATELLLRHLVSEGRTVGEAVEATAAEAGPDPSYGSELRVYPPTALTVSLR